MVPGEPPALCDLTAALSLLLCRREAFSRRLQAASQPACRHVRRSDRHGRLLPGQPGQRAGCVLLGIPAERRQEGAGGPGLWSDPRRSVTALILMSPLYFSAD